jgi:hypothetical protein
MININERQFRVLRRLKKRLKGEQYQLRLVLVYATALMPGYFSITARTPELYERAVKLLHKAVPNASLKYETGRGWHTGDRTEYHFGSFDFMLESKNIITQ